MDFRWNTEWSDLEREERLILTRTLAINYEADPGRMLPSTGWNQVSSQALVGWEEPGAPRGEGAFWAAKLGIERLVFSDPRIVRPYFSPEAPLLGRDLLFELRGVGFRFLAPVRVGAVHTEETPDKTVFGYCLDTLEGHLEQGREWFVLTKEHATGEIRFHIQASWRQAPLPPWAALGFGLFGRRYQRAWHHLAHLRLREALQAGAPGFRSAKAPAEFWSLRAVGARLSQVEHEHEVMRRDRLWVSAGFGFLAGLRSLLGPAFLGWSLVRSGRRERPAPARQLGDRRVATALTGLALLELAADKLPGMPARTTWAPLGGRLAAGATLGAAVAARGGHKRLIFALAGMAGALAGSFAGVWTRRFATRRLGLANPVAGALEDGVALALGRRLYTAQGELRNA